jgi:hypothetical protein
MPEFLLRLRQRKAKAFPLPLPTLTAADRFKEIMTEKTYLRLYFNDYQYRFNFLLAQNVRFHADANLAKKEFYMCGMGPTLFHEVFMPPDPSRHLIPVKRVDAMRRTEVFPLSNRIGCTEKEVDLLFPALGNCQWVLLVELDLENSDLDRL